MFKVSFKDNPRDPAKIVLRVGNKTAVMLKGTVVLPEFFKYLPDEIVTCMTDKQKLISGEEDIATNTFHIKVSARALCHENDKFDYVFGERLAEARAKLKIYKFFYEFTSRLYDYYDGILFGDGGIIDAGEGNCIAQDVKKYEALCIREAHHIGELLKSKEENG